MHYMHDRATAHHRALLQTHLVNPHVDEFPLQSLGMQIDGIHRRIDLPANCKRVRRY